MNFFGHAVIAGGYSTHPEFVLGSMLPDFLSMLSMAKPRLYSEQLRAGVAFHHQTDLAFHQSSVFLDLQRRSFVELIRGGMRRGPARATAHVGVELLIDLALAQELRAGNRRHQLGVSWELYEAALMTGTRSALRATPLFEDAGGHLMSLCTRLAQLGRRRFEGGPEASVAIVRRAVSGRPRLELSSEEARVAEAWAPRLFPTVESQLGRLLDELETTLPAAAV